jgi:hypothetical protein
VALAIGWAAVATAADEPVPVSVRTAPGRFEIAAVDAAVAFRIGAAAEEAWRTLAAPLELPEAFPSPVYVRVGAAAEPGGREPFRVAVEPGGLVSVWLEPPAADGPLLRQAIVQGLLTRVAAARQGAAVTRPVPLWLERACDGWWRTRSDAAQADALRQASEGVAPLPLGELLEWPRGAPEPRALAISAVWCLAFLQAESAGDDGWRRLLPRLLAGEEPAAALAACFPDRYADETERELWWQTGFHHLRRARALPNLESAESRARLGALARFVFAAREGDGDAVIAVRDVVARADEPIVAGELARRAAEAARLVPALHPFYRNAGLSLAELLRSAGRDGKRREALLAAFEQDWSDAVELERATRAALDRLERR